MKAIVTGANGFVGSAVCRELSASGIQVIAVVRDSVRGKRALCDIPGIRVVCCDMSGYTGLPDMIPDRDIDVWYHFAWAGSAGALRGDLKVQLSNVEHACSAVRVCADLGCKRFVFASSIMEFEIASAMKAEITPGMNTLYASAKLAADYMARTVAGSLGVSFIRAVISNIYGPGETSPRLINTSIRKMLSGEHCAFTAGDQLYDFIYVDDAAKMFVELGKKGKKDKTYYIGNRTPLPLKEYLLQLRDAVDPGIAIGLGEIPYNGVSLDYGDIDTNSVMEDTGCSPTVGFLEGVKRTAQWIQGEMGP